MATATEERVQPILRRMSALDDARQLFAELNYDQARDRLSRHGWGEAARDALADDPQVIASHGDFQVIYCRLREERLLRGQQRPVVTRLLQQHPYALFLFSTSDQSRWHFLNVKYDEDTGRRRLGALLGGHHQRLGDHGLLYAHPAGRPASHPLGAV